MEVTVENCLENLTTVQADTDLDQIRIHIVLQRIDCFFKCDIPSHFVSIQCEIYCLHRHRSRNGMAIT